MTWVEAECFPEVEAATRKSLEQRIRSFPESFFLAEDDENMTGFVNWCMTNERTISDEMFSKSLLHDPIGKYQAIFGLDVIPEFRNRGVAAKQMVVHYQSLSGKIL